MAEAVVVDSWAGEDVKVGDVLDALAGLRRSCGLGATRTSVVSLVVVAASNDDADMAGAAVRGLGGRFPGRVLVLVPGARLDAVVDIVSAEEESHSVWSEQVLLSVGGELWRHLDSLVEPLTLPDLPVVGWYASAVPEPDDPLAPALDVVVVDTKQLGDAGAFGAIARLTRKHTVIDLAWSRLRPWRELLAGVYDGRPVTHATVRGKEGPRRLLAGWLSSRLALPRAAITLEDARHVSMRLSGPDAVFEVSRDEGSRVVKAGAAVEGGASYTDVLPLPDESLPWSLADALTHLGRDRVWEQALGAAS